MRDAARSEQPFFHIASAPPRPLRCACAACARTAMPRRLGALSGTLATCAIGPMYGYDVRRAHAVARAYYDLSKALHVTHVIRCDLPDALISPCSTQGTNGTAASTPTQHTTSAPSYQPQCTTTSTRRRLRGRRLCRLPKPPHPKERLCRLPKPPHPKERLCRLPKPPHPKERLCRLPKPPHPKERICRLPKPPHPKELCRSAMSGCGLLQRRPRAPRYSLPPRRAGKWSQSRCELGVVSILGRR